MTNLCSLPQPSTALTSVCGADYGNVSSNICTNQAFPNGDVSFCLVLLAAEMVYTSLCFFMDDHLNQPVGGDKRRSTLGT